MVRLVIIGVVVAAAFSLYALVDAAMTDASRARGLTKPVWVVITVLLPVVGGLLWFLIGKGDAPRAQTVAPDDDPRFTGTRMSGRELDGHMRDLERRLRELDDERFPGEEPPGAETPTDSAAEAGPESDPEKAKRRGDESGDSGSPAA